MEIKNWILTGLCISTLALGGCKTDSEDDMPGWGDNKEDTTPDTPNNNGSGDEGKLVINEICGLQDPDDDWMELFNNSSADVDLSGARIVKTDETGKDKDIYVFPANTVIKTKEYLVIATLSGELQAGISNKKQVGLELFAGDGTGIDKFDRDSDIGEGLTHQENGSYARMPNGTGQWIIVTKCTRGTENK